MFFKIKRKIAGNVRIEKAGEGMGWRTGGLVSKINIAFFQIFNKLNMSKQNIAPFMRKGVI